GNYYTVFLWEPVIDLKIFNIQIRELYALLVAVLTFRRFWIRKQYIIHMDNVANIYAVRKGACDNSQVMELIRLLTKEQIKGSFMIRLVHIRTDLNTTADRLSRGSIQTVQAANPNLIRVTLVFPSEFEQLGLLTQGGDGAGSV